MFIIYICSFAKVCVGSHELDVLYVDVNFIEVLSGKI